MAEFGTFDAGNALFKREQIIAARQSNEQQNILAERAAMFNPLLQSFLAGETDINALAQVDLQGAQNALDLQQDQQAQAQQQEQTEADEIVRKLLLVRNSANKKTFVTTVFPDFVKGLEEQGIDFNGLADDEIDNLLEQMFAQFAPASSFSLEDLGIKDDQLRSAAGKEFEDRQQIVSEFGEGSPQVARFDESAEKAPLVSITGDPIRDIAAEEAAKFRGRAAGERIAKFTSESDEARAQNLQLSRAAQFVGNVELQGPGTKIFNQLKAVGVAFGVDIEALGVKDDTASAQALESVSNEIALRLRNPDSGLGLTGNTSDRDITFLKSIPPSLGKTKGGNELIIDYAVRLNDHKIKRARVVQKFVRKHKAFGTDSQGRTLDGVLEQFANDNQIFSDKDFERLARAIEETETDNGPPVISTQEQFDSLATGTIYIDSDTGLKARKQ